MKRSMIAVLSVVAVLLAIGSAAQATNITIDMVTVGNAGNTADTTGYGAVSYAYNIGKYEVTAGQYTEFLNKVAQTDTYGLYDSKMVGYGASPRITRTGLSGSYSYSVASDYVNRPVTYVSWGDAARFTNWLHNGQPTGAQNASTTEDGAYYLNGATSVAALMAVTRKSDAKWALPSEDEWYKAAYYDPATASYFDYPTSSNTEPGRDMTDVSGNNANYCGTPYPITGVPNVYTTVVGEFQNSASPYGTFDQGGNVWEWNEAILYPDTNYAHRGLRGGSFSGGSGGDIFLLASDRGYGSGGPADENYHIGFRVSQVVPEPSSIMALAGGLISLLGIRRRRV